MNRRERRYERKMARRSWHRTPWRPCYGYMGGFCLRCLWRALTGANRRALRRHLTWRREVSKRLTPRPFPQRPEHQPRTEDTPEAVARRIEQERSEQ